jgi:hypothetical protein
MYELINQIEFSSVSCHIQQLSANTIIGYLSKTCKIQNYFKKLVSS